jgi:hypothetical protein
LVGNVIHEVAVGARNKGYREKTDGATPVSFLTGFTGKSGEIRLRTVRQRPALGVLGGGMCEGAHA